jgi:ABC-type polysaccharide/polyol phosphate transport system ATPase subunit
LFDPVDDGAAMTSVQINNANVLIPIYDSHALRLIRLPSFRRAKVGTSTISHSGSVIRMHALKDFSLDLSEGESVSVIGHNGAGKTTLLRLIAGIYPPSSGSLHVSGRVVALLNNSVGLNLDATGYENIELTATLNDWPAEHLPEYIRDVEAFTELGEYLSLPTRVYSAGMRARLALALATIQSPDILLIDEGINAGDADFQEKAKVRVREFVSRAKIVLLATHSQELSRALCSRALLLSKGAKIFFGDVDEAFARYAQLG